LGLKHKDF
jgi:hypothetical protein